MKSRISSKNSIGFFLWRMTWLCVSIIAVPVVMSGCIADNPSETEALTIYSGRSEKLVDPIIKQFSDVTGISVVINYASTPQLVATLLEEGKKSPADVFLAQDPGGLGAVENLFSKLPENILTKVPDWAHSSEGKWVSLSGRARTVIYNTDRLTEADLPDDIWGFTDRSWSGRIGWAPANTSFQTMVTAMRKLWGDDKTRRWLQGIKANNPVVYPKNTPIVAAVAAGEVDVGFVNHYYLHRFMSEEGESFPARNYHPRAGGPGSIILVAGAGILSTSNNKGTGEKFLEFMLSQVAQQYFASQTFEYPLSESVETPHVMTPLAQINNPTLAMQDLSDLKGTQDLLRKAGVLY